MARLILSPGPLSWCWCIHPPHSTHSNQRELLSQLPVVEKAICGEAVSLPRWEFFWCVFSRATLVWMWCGWYTIIRNRKMSSDVFSVKSTVVLQKASVKKIIIHLHGPGHLLHKAGVVVRLSLSGSYSCWMQPLQFGCQPADNISLFAYWHLNPSDIPPCLWKITEPPEIQSIVFPIKAKFEISHFHAMHG